MSRIIVAVLAMAVAVAVAAGTGVSAAEKKDQRGHHYFWVQAPPTTPDRDCDARLLSELINRGDICPADDAPLSPPPIGR